MWTKDEAEWGLTGTAVDMYVIRICEGLYEGFAIFFGVPRRILKTSKDHLHVSLGLAVGSKWYVIVMKCLTPSKVHITAKILLVNCTPFSVKDA